MALARWWNTFTRKRPPASGSTGFADAVAAPPRPVAARHRRPNRVPPPVVAAIPPPDPAAIESTAALDAALSTDQRLAFFCWMVAVPESASADARPPELLVGNLLERLDEVIASETLRAGLLPRAPHVIPQLMKTLRDESYSSVDVASRISKDVVLTAEVVRSATSAFQRGEDEAEINLAHAVTMVGTQGLRRAIANVVLRPIFDARGDTFSARAAAQIWQDADRKARLGAVLAAQLAVDPFDGYLAGLLHNTGWTALLRAIDGLDDIGLSAAQLAHPHVVPQLLQRRDALFGALVAPWNLSAGLDGVAGEVGRVGVDGVESPLGRVLRRADRLAAMRALTPAGQGPGKGVPAWATLPKPVRDCYAGLTSR